MALDQQPSDDKVEFDAVPAIVEALREKFGADALTVARVQHDAANGGESQDVWAEVVTRLDG